jgi:hypothetical protein
MQEIGSLSRQIDDEDNLRIVKARIAHLILRRLDSRRDALDHWEKMHFANAIGSLLMNLDPLRQSRTGWLRLCLSELEQALMPEAERNHGMVALDTNAEELSYEQLLKALDSIMRKLRSAC